MDNIKLGNWSLWLQGEDEHNNIKRYRLQNPKIPNPIVDEAGLTIELGEEEK